MFSPLRLTKLYEGAVAQIFAAIRDGRLHVGDRLPPERDMATQMEVSRSSVRTALRPLADVGILETRADADTSVKSDATNALVRSRMETWWG